MSTNNNGVNKGENKYLGMMNKPKPEGSVHDQFFGPIEKDKDIVEDNTNPNHNANLPDNIEVSVTSIPVAKKKKSIRETHKSKAFYIRKEIAKLIEQDIKNSNRGDMTKIANALFEEYYRSD